MTGLGGGRIGLVEGEGDAVLRPDAGILCQGKSRSPDRGAAVIHHHFGAAALRQAEIDHRVHVLRHHVGRGTAAMDHGGGNGGDDQVEQELVLQAEGGDGVLVGVDVL